MTGININKVISKKNVEYWFNVTDILQSMIGECIEKAEILVVEDTANEDAKDNLEIACRTANTILRDYNKYGILQFNCMTLRIKFKEGDTLCFNNSQFGTISKG